MTHDKKPHAGRPANHARTLGASFALASACARLLAVSLLTIEHASHAPVEHDSVRATFEQATAPSMQPLQHTRKLSSRNQDSKSTWLLLLN